MTLFKRGKSSHELERVKQPNGDSIFDILSEGTFSLEFLSICRVFDFTQNEQKFTLYRFFIDFRLGSTRLVVPTHKLNVAQLEVHRSSNVAIEGEHIYC